MTELEIYKFLHDESKCKQMEWQSDCIWLVKNHHTFNDEKEFRKEYLNHLYLAVWIVPEYLREFAELLGYSQFDDGGVECDLCYDGCVYIGNFETILEEHDIEPTNILPKPTND